MQWIKKGLVYCPNGDYPWAKRYAFPPTPYFVDDSTLRLYVAFCDDGPVGRVGYVDVSAANPSRLLGVSREPVLDIGEPGAFDENGVLPTCVVPVGDKLYLYYVGYQLGQKIRYFQFQGLAISEDGGKSFQRYSRTPILERSDSELHHRTSAFVMREESLFRLWYVGGSSWVTVGEKSLPVYNLRYLESCDGKIWPSEGQVCLDFKDADEHAFGRPFVIGGEGFYRMFYSLRTISKGYRLGYAESEDGLHWVRKDDEVGLDVSSAGWDSEMIAYSSVASHKGQVYLFYNGNNCGETGFGYAVLQRW